MLQNQNSKAQQKWAIELIEKLNLNLEGSQKNVLDVGCGDGKISLEIAKKLHRGSVIGVDSSTSMIELATKKYPINEYPNLSFQIMDAVNLTFEEKFDLIFSNACLHWVKNHQPVLEGLYRSLKKNGKILLQMGGKGNAAVVVSILDELKNSSEWKQYFTAMKFPYGFFGIEEYKKLLTEAGFSINRVELIPKDMLHEGKTGLEAWIRTTWLPYVERVPEAHQKKFIKTLATEYINQVPMDSNGKVHVAMVRLEVEAEKT